MSYTMFCEGCGQPAISMTRENKPICPDCLDEGYGDDPSSELITNPTEVSQSDIDLFISLWEPDESLVDDIQAGRAFTGEIKEIARHRIEATTEKITELERILIELGELECPKCSKFGDDCGEHAPSELDLLKMKNKTLRDLLSRVLTDTNLSKVGGGDGSTYCVQPISGSTYNSILTALGDNHG